MSYALLAGFANFYTLAPFAVQDLVGTDAALRIRVKYAIYDVPAASLAFSQHVLMDSGSNMQLTLWSDSMGGYPSSLFLPWM